MKLSDEECVEFARVCSENGSPGLTVDEAREILSQLVFLFEHFAIWLSEQARTGAIPEIDIQ